MSNWHYNGCPPAGILFALPRSAQLGSECIEPAATKSRGYNWNFPASSRHSLWSVLNRKLCSHFAQLFLGLGTRLSRVGGGKPLWFYEVIAIIVVHTQKTLINTIVVHLVWPRECFTPGLCPPFIPLLTLKINAIYCCPFAKKEKGKARKKREENGKTSRKLHNRNACVINFKKKIHSITSQKIIWKIKNRPCQQQWEQPQQQQQRWRRQQQKRKAKSKKAEHSTKSRVIYAPPRELCAEQNRQCVSSPTPHHPVPFLTNRAPAPYPSGNWNAQYKGRECGRCSSQEARLQICLKQAFYML